MLQLPCIPPTLQQEAQIDEVSQINTMLERIRYDANQNGLSITSKDEDPRMILRFLKSQNFNIEFALNKWQRWVTWKKSNDVDNITEEEVQFELTSKQAYWKGMDRNGRTCCVIVGRHHNPLTRPPGSASFKKFLVYMVLKGCALADESGQREICLIYDRRGLEFRHLDQPLFLLCRQMMADLSEFYGDRVGAFYIVHSNFLLWSLFHVVVRPFLSVILRRNPLILVDNWEGLLPYFDPTGLPPDPLTDTSPHADVLDSAAAAAAELPTVSNIESVPTMNR